MTSLMGSIVMLDDPLAARVLALLDGTRHRPALLRALRDDESARACLRDAARGLDDGAALERCLDALGRCALLRASG